MHNLKDRLIRLGSQNPELRKHIRPVLDRLSHVSDGPWKNAPSDKKWEGQHGVMYDSLFEAIKSIIDDYMKGYSDKVRLSPRDKRDIDSFHKSVGRAVYDKKQGVPLMETEYMPSKNKLFDMIKRMYPDRTEG
jgi:hypothetical protein